MDMGAGVGGPLLEPRQEETQVPLASKGWLRCSVDKEYLRSLNFTWGEVAALLVTSSKTLQRKVKAFPGTPQSLLDGAFSDVLRHFEKRSDDSWAFVVSKLISIVIIVLQCGSSAGIKRYHLYYKDWGGGPSETGLQIQWLVLWQGLFERVTYTYRINQ